MGRESEVEPEGEGKSPSLPEGEGDSVNPTTLLPDTGYLEDRQTPLDGVQPVGQMASFGGRLGSGPMNGVCREAAGVTGVSAECGTALLRTGQREAG
jgi:hypothetical protein